MTKREVVSKGVRIVTAAPFFALILCTVLYFAADEGFASLSNYFAAIVFLTVMPLLSYPITYFVPNLRKKGRKLERSLAIVFSVVGYICGVCYTFIQGGTACERVLYLTYLTSGVILAVCTCLKFKASGHTCGCSGPVAMLSAFVSPWFLFGYLLLIPVVYSSASLKRHTPLEMIAGGLVPIAAMLVSILIFC